MAKNAASDSSSETEDGLLRSPRGVIAPCEYNARLLIERADRYDDLHFDEFLSCTRIADRDWTDADDLECVCWLQSAHSVAKFTLGQARNAVRAVGHARRRDSLCEYVERLPEWDGIQRVETAFIEGWGAPDSPLMRAAARNLLIALIARAMRPGAKVDSLWCFEGPQGIRKSMALSTLGGDFHAEITAGIGTTDFMRELRGIWLAELSELDSLRGRESSTIKRLLSATSDRFVEKYQTHTQVYQRRAVAVATTNEAAYWQDSTGARRLIPIACTAIDIDLIAANRPQWFAEAKYLYDTSATWWEFPATIVAAQDDRQQSDPWEDVIRDAIAHGRRVGVDHMHMEPWPTGPIASATIMRDWLRLEPHQQGRVSSTRLGSVMRRLGFEPTRIGHEQARGWVHADT